MLFTVWADDTAHKYWALDATKVCKSTQFVTGGNASSVEL